MKYAPLPMPLARAIVDRHAERRTEEGLIGALREAEATRVLVVGDGVLGRRGDSGAELVWLSPAQSRGFEGWWAYLGSHAGIDYLGLALAEHVGVRPPVEGCAWLDVRDVGAALDDAEAGLAVSAFSLARWHRSHQFCPACGQPTELVEAGWAARCPADGSLHYPRTDPAVIMAITDSADRIVLGRGIAWRDERRFSILAGYVEAGEGLESAVRREVLEEAGIEVGDVRYLGNQPWPPSSSLMVAFAGQALTTELTVDPVELAEARWFTREELDAAQGAGLVELPPPAAVAHTVIEAWRRGEL